MPFIATKLTNFRVNKPDGKCMMVGQKGTRLENPKKTLLGVVDKF